MEKHLVKTLEMKWANQTVKPKERNLVHLLDCLTVMWMALLMGNGWVHPKEMGLVQLMETPKAMQTALLMGSDLVQLMENDSVHSKVTQKLILPLFVLMAIADE